MLAQGAWSAHVHVSLLTTMQVHHRIVESLLQLVEAERGGEAVNRYLLKHSVDMLSNLRLYEDGVQDTLLQSASQYYTRESQALINVGASGQVRELMAEVCCAAASAGQAGARKPDKLSSC